LELIDITVSYDLYSFHGVSSSLSFAHPYVFTHEPPISRQKGHLLKGDLPFKAVDVVIGS
jgi:hypothetical protein